MDYSPAEIMTEYMIQQGLVTDPSDQTTWPIYTGLLPDDGDVEDDIVACMDTEAVKDGRIFSSGENIFHYGFQFLVRAVEYNDAWQKAKALEDACELINRDEVDMDSTVTYRLDNVTLTTGVTSLGQEEGSKRRQIFSVNFLVTLKEI